MKKFTNYAPGARGIRTTTGMVFLDPGQSVEIEEGTIIGALPDLGKAADTSAATSEVDDLKEWVDDLTKQVAALTEERDGLATDKADLSAKVDDLTKQVAALSKPSK